MKQFIVILLSIFCLTSTFACLNGETKILNNGIFLYEDREGKVPYGHVFESFDYDQSIKQLDSLYIATKDLDYLSDKGILLILLEKYEEAIKLYLEIEKIEPNRYSTASNIGTAYELFGQNENALKWIKKSVAIDPKSHHKSEWIHVNILDAKIKGEQYYNTNFLLNTEFGSGVNPNSQLTRQQLQDLSNALYYQLNERISFVKPKEKIVALLLFELGNVAFILGNYNEAIADYEQATRYGYDGEVIQQRINEVEKLRTGKKLRQSISAQSKKRLPTGIWIFGIALLTVVIVLMYRRAQKYER